ncbi:hypothetical protein MMC25_005891 [Agyrium rufum]|nr:hypothetical protein [Agyrium rufum]
MAPSLRSLLCTAALVATQLVHAAPAELESRAVCGSIPANFKFTENYQLPDPFTSISGSKVTTKSEWACRQNEISQLFQRYELGTKPTKPAKVSGKYKNGTLTITAGQNGKSISWNVSITYPTTGKAPYPALIAYDGLSIPAPAGVAIIVLNNDLLGLQNNASSRGVGLFYDLYGSDATASAMMAWAWGVSRVIDVLETTPAAKINPERIGVTGCSRDGKGAMVAGAFDSRIVLTIPQESGSGGDTCWRLSDAMLDEGQVTQTASEIVNENVWFSEEFANFSTNTNLLPFDHHLLAGLIAPRGLLSFENSAVLWLGSWSAYGCMKTANRIYQALGVPENHGFSEVGNHSHCLFPDVQVPVLDAFVGKFLLDQAGTNTSVFEDDSSFRFDIPNAYVQWATPTLS